MSSQGAPLSNTVCIFNQDCCGSHSSDVPNGGRSRCSPPLVQLLLKHCITDSFHHVITRKVITLHTTSPLLGLREKSPQEGAPDIDIHVQLSNMRFLLSPTGCSCCHTSAPAAFFLLQKNELASYRSNISAAKWSVSRKSGIVP